MLSRCVQLRSSVRVQFGKHSVSYVNMLRAAVKSLPSLQVPIISYNHVSDDYSIIQNQLTSDLFKPKSLLLGITGAFFPSMEYHFLPEYRKYALELKTLGKLENIYVISINDAFTLRVFAEEIDAEYEMVYISDFSGELCRSLGATLNLERIGERSRPFRCVVENSEVSQLEIEEDWRVTSKTRVHRMMTQISPYAPYPRSIYKT